MDYIKFYKGNKRFVNTFIQNLEILKFFSIYIDSDYYNASSKTFFVMNNNRIYTTMTSMLKTVETMKKIIQIINKKEYKFLDFYIKNNVVNVRVIISPEYTFENNLKVFMRYCTEKEKFEENIVQNHHSLLSTYINSHTKVLVDFKCGHTPNYITPNSYNNGVRCPVCSNQKTEIGVNNILQKRPDIIKYLKNKDDALKYQPYSKKRIMFLCDKCGYEKEYEINTVSSFGFSCPNCSDGISYPNKFISNLLCELDIEFDAEVQFDWCKFKKYNSNTYMVGRYDIVIDSKKVIIEMDGSLGHGNNSFSKSKDESVYIDNIKDKLAKSNGYILIRIPCKYKNIKDRFKVVKESILSSDLSQYIDLSKVDWNNINNLSEISYITKAIELFNSGDNLGAKDIGKILHISTTCASNYLKIGNDMKLCDFGEHTYKNFRCKKLLLSVAKPMCLTNLENNDSIYFCSQSECSRYFSKHHLYIKDNKTRINGIIYKTTYISFSEFNNMKRNNPRKTFGELFLLDGEVV